MSEYLDLVGMTGDYKTITLACEICGHEEFVDVLSRGRCAEAGVYGPLPIKACTRCGAMTMNPRYEERFYVDYYHKRYRTVAFGADRPTPTAIEWQRTRSARVLEYIQTVISPPGRMLDLGCAAGATMLPFRDAGWDIQGIDPDAGSVQTGQEFLGLPVTLGRAESLPFPDGSFNLLISLGAHEHVYDFAATMRECRRVLAPNGVILIRYRNPKIWGSPIEYFNHNHYRYFSPKIWRLALIRFGFTPIAETEREIEGNTGAAYMVGRADRAPSMEAVHDALARGEGECAEDVRGQIGQCVESYRERSRQFLRFAEEREFDVDRIFRECENGKVNFRLLGTVPREDAVARAILEAKTYLAEYERLRPGVADR